MSPSSAEGIVKLSQDVVSYWLQSQQVWYVRTGVLVCSDTGNRRCFGVARGHVVELLMSPLDKRVSVFPDRSVLPLTGQWVQLFPSVSEESVHEFVLLMLVTSRLEAVLANCQRSSCSCCLAGRNMRCSCQSCVCPGNCGVLVFVPKIDLTRILLAIDPNACGRWCGRVNVLRTFVVVRGRCSSALCKTSTVVRCAVDFVSPYCKHSFLVYFFFDRHGFISVSIRGG